MRYLGIDYGSKRIGLALSDPQGRVALPYGIASRPEDIAAVIKKEGVGGVVVGMPFSRLWVRQAEDVKRFAAKLSKEVRLPIEFEDEAFTTKIAEGSSSKEKVDASAAAIILQSYLDKKNQEL